MMYDSELINIINQVFSRLYDDAKSAGPCLGEHIIEWMHQVYGSERPQDAFMDPASFPMLLLPWYAESSLNAQLHQAFQSDLVYSTVNGYYYIRLMDNLMDGHGKEQLSMLPALSFFHTNFQSAYQRYFEHYHPFWDYFNEVWLHSAEVTLRDAQLMEIDRELFMEVSSHKTCAAKIPVAAVFYLYDRPELVESWARFIDLFGCWHQMWNDFFDWIKDTRCQTQTYFLSHANHRKRPDEPVIDWVIREGFDWGMGVLDDWLDELGGLADGLSCPQLVNYMQERRTLLSEQSDEAMDGLMQTGKLLEAFKKSLEELEGK